MKKSEIKGAMGLLKKVTECEATVEELASEHVALLHNILYAGSRDYVQDILPNVPDAPVGCILENKKEELKAYLKANNVSWETIPEMTPSEWNSLCGMIWGRMRQNIPENDFLCSGNEQFPGFGFLRAPGSVHWQALKRSLATYIALFDKSPEEIISEWSHTAADDKPAVSAEPEKNPDGTIKVESVFQEGPDKQPEAVELQEPARHPRKTPAAPQEQPSQEQPPQETSEPPAQEDAGEEQEEGK